VSTRARLGNAVVLLVALEVAGCSGGRRDATPLERGAVREVLVDEDGSVPGGGLDAQVRKDDRLDLRVFVRGAAAPGSIVHLRGYDLSARVKRQPPELGFWARLRFRATRAGRFAVVLERPQRRQVKVGYVTVNP
jgi:hypothetical protein